MSRLDSDMVTSVSSPKIGRVSGHAAFGVAAGGTLLAAFGASAAQAQVVNYTSGLTANATNPTVYFSATTGASSYASFTGANFTINYTAGSEPSISSVTSSDQMAYGASACDAAHFTAGNQINAATTQSNLYTLSFDTSEGWTYPGTGFFGFAHNNGVGFQYGYGSLTTAADDSAKLNGFSVQQTPGAAIVVGGAAPDADPLALLALGGTGLAALRLLRKSRESSASMSA